jgi:Rrf2 family protein
MYITARADYAIRAMAELAVLPPVERRAVSAVAVSADIPVKFLEAIFGDLVKASLVTSKRGAGGGYALARATEEISIADIVRAVDGPLAAVGGRAPEQTTYVGPSAALTSVWIALRAAMRDVLEATSLHDVVTGSFSPDVQRWLAADGAWERRGR